jgi:hypothetical protein
MISRALLHKGIDLWKKPSHSQKTRSLCGLSDLTVGLLGIAFSIFRTSSGVTSRSFAGETAATGLVHSDRHKATSSAMDSRKAGSLLICFDLRIILAPFLETEKLKLKAQNHN